VFIAAREDTSAVLLLFDIDGTILQNASTEHALAMRIALRSVYGIVEAAGDSGALSRVPAAGRTDLEIAREIALLCGCSAEAFDDGREDLMEACVREYARLVPDDLSDRVVRGMSELLAELAASEGVLPALVTGNLQGIARLKLARAGVGEFFLQGQGAFGSDSEDRTDLPAIARQRAAAGGEPYPRRRTLVIGDTPLDIVCARADGLRCLAVCSGPYGAAELGHADGVAENTERLRELLCAERQRIRSFSGAEGG
jgi:phosphoglycolate phosphatase